MSKRTHYRLAGYVGRGRAERTVNVVQCRSLYVQPLDIKRACSQSAIVSQSITSWMVGSRPEQTSKPHMLIGEGPMICLASSGCCDAARGGAGDRYER